MMLRAEHCGIKADYVIADAWSKYQVDDAIGIGAGDMCDITHKEEQGETSCGGQWTGETTAQCQVTLCLCSRAEVMERSSGGHRCDYCLCGG